MRVIGRSVAQLCASPEYLARSGVPEKPADLLNHQQLLTGSRDRFRAWILQTGSEAPFTIPGKPLFLCDNAGAISDAAVAGLGIACLPTFLTQEDIKKGMLQRVMPGYNTPVFPICVVYPTRRQLSPKVRHFIDWLTERLTF